MKQLIATLLIILLPTVALQAESLEEQTELIGECLDDVTRLEEGRQLLQQLLSTADIERQPLYPQLLYLKSYYYINTGEITSAKHQLLALQRLLPAKGLDELTINVPHDLGFCYRREGQNDSALFYYDRALHAAQARNDLEWQASINLNIGILHFNLDHAELAEPFLQRAISQVRQVDDPYTELCALQVNGSVKRRLGKYDEARASIEPAYLLALKSESPDWQLRCLSTMLYVYDTLQLPDSTAVTLQRGDALLPLLPPKSITSTGYLTARGSYYQAHQQWQLAAADLQLAVDNQTGGAKTFDIYNSLSICYARLQLWQQAYTYKDSASVWANEAAKEQFAQQLADFNVRYQTVEKDLEITRLHSQRTRLFILAIPPWPFLPCSPPPSGCGSGSSTSGARPSCASTPSKPSVAA